DDAPDLLEVGVARDDLDEGVADGDEGLAEVLLRVDRAGGPEEGAVRRPLEPALHRVRPHRPRRRVALSLLARHPSPPVARAARARRRAQLRWVGYPVRPSVVSRQPGARPPRKLNRPR